MFKKKTATGNTTKYDFQLFHRSAMTATSDWTLAYTHLNGFSVTRHLLSMLDRSPTAAVMFCTRRKFRGAATWWRSRAVSWCSQAVSWWSRTVSLWFHCSLVVVSRCIVVVLRCVVVVSLLYRGGLTAVSWWSHALSQPPLSERRALQLYTAPRIETNSWQSMSRNFPYSDRPT